jgi:OOP family OmpA-OmpF porin
MKIAKSLFAPVIILAGLVTLQACKAKKMVQKPTETAAVSAPVEQTKSAPVVPPPPPPVPPVINKPDYDFSNIQFEFNSSVLKTGAYVILDKAAAAMKVDPSVKFNLKGYASEEGTPEHNQILSQDRANSVKEYLINSGVKASDLTARGFGTSNPIADNSTESGKELNRRVELGKQN